MKKEYDLSKLTKRAGKIKVGKDASKIPISLRVDGSVLASLKEEAKRIGIPYQTFIGSVLYRYSTGELVDKKALEIFKALKAS